MKYPAIYTAVLAGLFFCGCANVSTTKFTYSSPDGGSVTVEMPKEMQATNLAVTIDAKQGQATIKADSMKTQNLEAVKAQLNAASDIAAKATQAGVEAAISSMKP